MGGAVLVIGSTEPVGRCVVAALTAHGEEIVTYDRPRAGRDEEPGSSLGELLDLPRLLQVVRDRGVDRIVHMGDTFRSHIGTDIVGVVEGTLHVLEAARLAGVTGRIVLLSSTSVYGDNAGPIDESSPLRPRTPQATIRMTTEQLGGIYADLRGLDVIALRLGDVYGPRLGMPEIVRTLISGAATGAPLHLPDGADQSFHLVHGEDVCRAVLGALDAARPTQLAYNITGGETHTLRDIAALVRDLNPGADIAVGPGHLPGYDGQGAIDISAADRDLGYRPRWGLARGLDDYADWFARQGHISLRAEPAGIRIP